MDNVMTTTTTVTRTYVSVKGVLYTTREAARLGLAGTLVRRQEKQPMVSVNGVLYSTREYARRLVAR